MSKGRPVGITLLALLLGVLGVGTLITCAIAFLRFPPESIRASLLALLGVASGVVTWSGRKQGFGNLLEIDHGNGYITRYAHNDELLVKAGEEVASGQVIARMGATGRASSPHVHFEVLYRGEPVNPYNFVKQNR